MNENFYTILTNVGLAKFANSQVTQTDVTFTKIAVGDGNGSYYNPTAAATALKKEVWRGNINSIYIDPDNPNWIVIEAIVPSDTGGFTIREVGAFDDAGNLLAIGKVPETYKPALTQGSAKDLYLKIILEVTNASAVTLKIDPAVTLASRKYVDDQITLKIGPLQQSITNLSQSVSNLKEEVTQHLAEINAQALKMTTSEINFYVSPSGDNLTGDGTQNRPFKTIQFAIYQVPLFLGHSANIILAAGTYDEDVYVHGFLGLRSLTITGASSISSANNYVIKTLSVVACTSGVRVSGVKVRGLNRDAIFINRCTDVSISNTLIIDTALQIGINGSNASISVEGCTISNRVNAIKASKLSNILSDVTTGEGNNVGLYAEYAGQISKAGTQPSGTTAEFTSYGGVIR